MDKLEKSYYAVIGNKKRGKFSGAGPIQVAKKVASKKLKAGKEMEFYLDEVSGKKKRFGPYQARKDKKSGKVAVVKGRKVMKGGLLSESDKSKLKKIFNILNNNGKGFPLIENISNSLLPTLYKKFNLPIISFYGEPIVFLNAYRTIYANHIIFSLAVFKERIGNIYIMIYTLLSKESEIDIVSMTEFFLNPYYFHYLNKHYHSFNNTINNNIYNNENKSKNKSKNKIPELNFNSILLSLQNPQIIESRTIREEARKIYDVLYIPITVKDTQKAMIYVPDYYKPRIMKCVYSDLTFGILDEETVNQRINQEMIKPESFYQLYLIKQQSVFNGYYEPVIYIQLPFNEENPIELELIKYNKYLNKQIHPQIIVEENKKNPYFNYCIYTDQTDRNILKIITYNSQTKEFLTDDFNEKLSNKNDIKIACSILLTIPVEFESLEGVRRIANSIITPPPTIC